MLSGYFNYDSVSTVSFSPIDRVSLVVISLSFKFINHTIIHSNSNSNEQAELFSPRILSGNFKSLDDFIRNFALLTPHFKTDLYEINQIFNITETLLRYKITTIDFTKFQPNQFTKWVHFNFGIRFNMKDEYNLIHEKQLASKVGNKCIQCISVFHQRK